MTTVIYKPEKFAACDSKWSIDGREIHGVRENKFVLFPSRSDGETHISFMCGTHIAIAVHQALYLQLLDYNEYFGLISRYTEAFDMQYDSVLLKLDTGEMRSRPDHSYYPLSKVNGAFHLGTGGEHAGNYYYHAPRWLRTKQRKKPPLTLLNECRIAGSVISAYSQDKASGGKVNKIEWNDGACVASTILPVHPDYFNTYKQALVNTIREIHDMYENKTDSDKTVSASANKNNSQGSHFARIKANAADSQATQVTLSRALEQIKLMQSL